MAVAGYINEIQTILPEDDPYFLINDLIRQICTLFYGTIHEWDLDFVSPNVKFVEQENSIEHIEDGESSSCFLKDTFSSGIHHWKFKIDNCKDIPHLHYK